MDGQTISLTSSLQKEALAVAAKIGKVEVDGETGCKTPDAAEYIRKTVEQKGQSRPKTAKA